MPSTAGRRFVLAAGLCLVAATAAAADDNVTFHRDVQPLLQRHCQTCHRPGQVAPMSLLTYKNARPWATAIRKRVLERSMPPWPADPAHGSFTNNRAMPARDIDTIRRWVDGGAVEGDPRHAPPPRAWPPEGWQMTPDVIVALPERRVPARGTIEWESVAVPFPVKRDAWITSLQVLPGDPSVVHHICFLIRRHNPQTVYNRFEWQDLPRDVKGIETAPGLITRLTKRLQPTFQARMAGSDEAVTVSGRSTLGLSGTNCYLPGLSLHDYRPHNAAKFVPAGSDLIVTLHYLTVGKPVVDRSRIGFTVTTTPPANQWVDVSPNLGKSLAIPPYDANYAAPPFEMQINRPSKLVWFCPHMHLRGKDITYTLILPDGRRQVLLKIPRYDFNWQLGYETAVDVPAGSRIRIEAHYDNSKGNKANPDPSVWVRRGRQSWEEMLTPNFSLVVDRAADIRGLTSQYEQDEGD
jgi:hypothetical protein